MTTFYASDIPEYCRKKNGITLKSFYSVHLYLYNVVKPLIYFHEVLELLNLIVYSILNFLSDSPKFQFRSLLNFQSQNS